MADFCPIENGMDGERAANERASADHLRTNSKLGFVYFIRAGRTNAVKIGYASDPTARLRELQCASQHPLHMLGYMPGTKFDEAEWHARFADERIRGEWFTLTAVLRDTINRLAVADCGFVQYLHLSLLTRNAA